jgi:predicted 3-demethylubiquinone-9 3-methyltransferase (glyoxalase superfamily)
MPAITPFMWFDDQAEEAVNFYVSLFRNSRIEDVTRYVKASAEVSGRPEGSIMTVAFQLAGQDFIALNGGPEFTFSPAVSFFVSCETPDEVDQLWQKLSDGGSVLMQLGKYPFSEKYGWLQDKYGVNWQLILADRAQKITPCLLFVGKQYGKAEEAMTLYTSLFKNSNIRYIERYQAGEASSEGAVKHAAFSLNGQEFIAMDSGLEHDFTFTLAISFMVNCKTQEEVDSLWEKLSEGGEKEAQQCGWLKDKYGVSWQIVPTVLHELLSDSNPEKAKNVLKALLQMKKIDIQKLRQPPAQCT